MRSVIQLLLVVIVAAHAAEAAESGLIRRSFRPPNYETPVEDLGQDYTPNDKFFVRNHLSGIPVIQLSDWKLEVGGESVAHPLTLDMAALKRDFTAVELPAVLICSGNQRSLMDPRVPGVQWGYGAMGNARWKGVRLKDVLAKAGLKSDAVEIVFDGADSPVVDKTPDFRKSLPMAKALDENTLIAYEMNGESLPPAQGFPARLVVPGWMATYWMKQLVSIQAIPRPFDGYWMKKAYRIPKGKFPAVETKWRADEDPATVPITEVIVNSVITSLQPGQRIVWGGQSAAKKSGGVDVSGIAWDGGHGIEKVEVSTDGGKSWSPGTLNPELGRYSWRRFHYRFLPERSGSYRLMARATGRDGQTQPAQATPNPGGYHHNSVEMVEVHIE